MVRQHLHTLVLAVLVSCPACVSVHTDGPPSPQAASVAEIKQARLTKDKLQREARELDEIGSNLETATARIAEHRVLTRSGSAEALLKNLIQSTSSLREAAKAILDKGPQYIAKIDSFAATLKSAPTTFTNAAVLFRSFADDEPYGDVADDYRQVAIMFDNLAKRSQSSSGSLQERYNRDKLLETLRYIRHQERFLDRLEAAIYAQTLAIDEIEAILREIDEFSARFEQLRAQIRDLNAAFQNVEATAATQQPAHITPPVAPPAPSFETGKPCEPRPDQERPADARISYQPTRPAAPDLALTGKRRGNSDTPSCPAQPMLAAQVEVPCATQTPADHQPRPESCSAGSDSSHRAWAPEGVSAEQWAELIAIGMRANAASRGVR